MIYKKIKDAKAKNKAMLAEAAKNASAEAASETEAQIVQNKIQKASLLKMNAFEAAKKGATDTGIDLRSEEEKAKTVNIQNVDSSGTPITYKSSALRKTGAKNDDPNKKVEKKIVSHEGTAKDYIKTMMSGKDTYNTKSINEAKGGGTLETDDQKYFKDLYGRFGNDVTTQELIDKKFLHSSKLDAYNTFTGSKNKGVLTPGKTSTNISLTPRKIEEKTDPTQTYNMDFKNSENANWAEGAQRRGTRRAERRAQRDLDIYSGEKRSGFLGLGGKKNKGKLSANVIAAAEKTGLKAKKLKEMGLNVDDKGSITGDSDQNVTEQMRSRATNLSMNKYNQGLNEFNYKPGSSKTVDESGEGYEVYDGPVGDIDTSTTVFSDFMKNKTFGGSLMSGFSSGLFPKSKLGKNAKAFKNKSGRGPGYQS